MKKILVIGGTGFIGSHLIKRLKDMKTYNIVSISKKKQNKKNSNKLKYFYLDIRNFRSLKKKLKNNFNFDYVVNLGGYINHSKTDGDKIFNEHVICLVNLFKLLSKKRLKNFIQIGSSAEYGMSNNTSESTRENPLTFYSAGKVAATQISQMLFFNEKIPITVLRFFQVYGPGQKDDRLIPYVIKSCLKNKKFNLTKCEQVRDFCYVDDIVNAIILCLKSKNVSGNVYNVSSGSGIKLKLLVKKIKKIIGKGYPKFGALPYQKIENMNLVANVKKFKRYTKWKHKTNLNAGLRLTINSYTD